MPYTMQDEQIFHIFDNHELAPGVPIGFVYNGTPLYTFDTEESTYVPNRINENYNFEKN